MLLGLLNERAGHRWPISWAVRRQSSTNYSAAEAETVAFSNCTKHEGIPMQILLDALSADCRRPMELVAKVDIAQAIAAAMATAHNYVSWKGRTIAALAPFEFVEDKQMRVEYAPRLTRRGDGFTKCLTPAKSFAARDMMSTAQPALQK